jgi:hypothetical protein
MQFNKQVLNAARMKSPMVLETARLAFARWIYKNIFAKSGIFEIERESPCPESSSEAL